MTEAPPILGLHNVSKHFVGVTALHDISLRVRAGEVLCLLGDNGAGKSTLIKILSGVHQPSSGQMLVDGEEVHFENPLADLQRGIATVHQYGGAGPLLRTARNLFLGG